MIAYEGMNKKCTAFDTFNVFASDSTPGLENKLLIVFLTRGDDKKWDW